MYPSMQMLTDVVFAVWNESGCKISRRGPVVGHALTEHDVDGLRVRISWDGVIFPEGEP